MKPHLVVVAFATLIASACRAQQAPTAEPTVTEARAADDPQLAPLLAKAKKAAEGGVGGQALLADKELAPLREVTEFRDLVAKNAPTGEVTIVPAGEPGTALLVRATVRDQDGKPAAGVLVYAYHTSSKGWYSDRAPHFTGGAGGSDVGHARLFAYVRTDEQGRFVLRTIRPGGYPRSTLPEHIHFHVFAGGDKAGGKEVGKEVGGGEILFDDDKRLTKEAREQAGMVVCKVDKEGEAQLVTPVIDVKLPAAPAPATKR